MQLAEAPVVEDVIPVTLKQAVNQPESPKEDGEIEEVEEEETEKVLHLRIRRRWIILGLFVLVLAGIGFSAWKFHWYQKAHDRYTAGSVTLKVKEGDTATLSGAHFSFRGTTYTTDDSGKVTLQNIPAGTYTFTLTKDGYLDDPVSLTLRKGDNGLVFYGMTKLPDKVYAVKGFVLDSISGLPIVNVQVTFGSKTVLTDPSGAYAFSNVIPGKGSVVLSKSGYTNKQIDVTVVDADVVNAQLAMVPVGQIVFVSNRDGHRALYTSAYDGSNQHIFTTPQNGGEDFDPSISPDGKNILFASTRGGQKDSYGNSVSQLYVVGQDGQNPKQVSADVSYDIIPTWSSDSAFAFFEAYTDTKLNHATYKIYNVAKGATIDIGEDAGGVVFAPNSSMIAYYVAGTVAAVTPTPSASPTATASPTDSPTDTPSTVSVNIIKTLNVLTGERKTVVSKQEYISNLVFGNDSKTLSYDVFITNNRQRMQMVLASGQESQVAAINSTRVYVPSPDKKSQVFAEQRDGKTDLYLVDAQGNNEKRLTTMGVINSTWTPQWDASGNYIVFADKRDSENALYIVATSGGDPKKIADYFLQQ